jgi:hypothetical protein
MSLAGIQTNSDWTPIKTFGGDDFWDIVAQILYFVIDREIMNYFALTFMRHRRALALPASFFAGAQMTDEVGVSF